MELNASRFRYSAKISDPNPGPTKQVSVEEIYSSYAADGEIIGDGDSFSAVYARL